MPVRREQRRRSSQTQRHRQRDAEQSDGRASMRREQNQSGRRRVVHLCWPRAWPGGHAPVVARLDDARAKTLPQGREDCREGDRNHKTCTASLCSLCQRSFVKGRVAGRLCCAADAAGSVSCRAVGAGLVRARDAAARTRTSETRSATGCRSPRNMDKSARART